MTTSVNEHSLDSLLAEIGEAGALLHQLKASEGGAGNISAMVDWEIEPGPLFPVESEIRLPLPVPELAGNRMIMSGSGRRLRDLGKDPSSNLGFLIINPGGETARFFCGECCSFTRLSTEFNSHLALHHNTYKKSAPHFNAVVHAQPLHLTFLTHIQRYQDEKYLNQHLFRWQAETIVYIPQGVAFIPYEVTSSDDLMRASLRHLGDHKVLVWAKHGIVTQSEVSVMKALDYVEYIESVAEYEYMNLAAGEPAAGMTIDEILHVCQVFNVHQTIYA